jgi:hypothetical protein
VTAGWTEDELRRIATAEELAIAPRRRDGALRAPTTIWVVRLDDDLYVRSWRGPTGGWFRVAQQTHEGHISVGRVDKDVRFVDAGDEIADAFDDAYRSKYGRYAGSYLEPMIAPQARATTLELVPCGNGPAR